MIKTLDEIMNLAKTFGKSRVVVPAAEDKHVIEAVTEAQKIGLIDACLIGNKNKILSIADELQIDATGYEILDELNIDKAIRLSIEMVNNGKADIIMKGMLQTADLLKAVLDKDASLRQKNRILSHVVILESKNYPKLLYITDVGLNVAPDLKQKMSIIQNTVDVALRLGNDKPKVAVLSAVEIVNPDMQCTMDAAVLSKMAERGQIKNCMIDGPLALDNAINKEAAAQKNLKGLVAGDADILLVPDIEAGNILYKGLSFLGGFRSIGGVIVGAKIPLVVVSRAESTESKLYSIALAIILSGENHGRMN